MEQADFEMETRHPAGEQGPRRGTRARRRPQSQFARRRKTCAFCEKEGAPRIDYKRADVLRSFLTERGKIRPRRQTGTCARHQRRLSAAIKRARQLALLPFVAEPRRVR